MVVLVCIGLIFIIIFDFLFLFLFHVISQICYTRFEIAAEFFKSIFALAYLNAVYKIVFEF